MYMHICDCYLQSSAARTAMQQVKWQVRRYDSDCLFTAVATCFLFLVTNISHSGDQIRLSAGLHTNTRYSIRTTMRGGAFIDLYHLIDFLQTDNQKFNLQQTRYSYRKQEVSKR
jgi:hypothetical protein